MNGRGNLKISTSNSHVLDSISFPSQSVSNKINPLLAFTAYLSGLHCVPTTVIHNTSTLKTISIISGTLRAMKKDEVNELIENEYTRGADPDRLMHLRQEATSASDAYFAFLYVQLKKFSEYTK